MIGSGFLVKPELKSPFPSGREYWTCPKTGLIVPKGFDDNMRYREDILHKAQYDTILQRDLLRACKDSVLYWINTFCYTKHEFEVDPVTGGRMPAPIPHWPLITWEIQDGLFDWFEDHFYHGESGLVDKSRDMGASWCGIAFIHWLWLFYREGTQLREMSRSEAYVDSPITKSLFYKHDYINTWLPEWMRPPGVMLKGRENRTSMRIHNALNGNTIAGESTTKHAMSADRCALLFLDEFSKVDNGDEIRTATYDAAQCRIVNSTVAGPGTAYSRWKNSGQIDVYSLMFWDHPDKGRGRFILQDEVTKTYRVSSPWLEHRKTECSDQEIAQECYAIDLEAGDMFFSLQEIEKHIALFTRPPVSKHNIILKEGIADEDISRRLQRRDTTSYSIKVAPNGKLQVWVQLIDGRPDQSFTYIFGIDTSKGQGASESVVSIKCKQTGEIIAKWRCNSTPPHEFSRVIVALALWVGGANPQRIPFLKWEKNGPGWDLGRLLVEIYNYPHYYCTKTIGTVVEKTTGKGALQKYGYHATREGKELLLRAYERALKGCKIINHDKEGLEQAKLYIYNQDGSVGPAELVGATAAEKKQHGDIVIADALTTEDSEVSDPKQEEMKIPPNSFAGRKKVYMQKRRRAKQRSRGWRKAYDYGS